MLRYIDGKHAFVNYEKELEDLIHSLNDMRSSVVKQFSLLTALVEKGKADQPDIKENVFNIDKDVNSIQHQLEKKVYNIILCHSPQIEELRLILAITKLASQFERMGDHCKSTAKQFWKSEEHMPDNIRQNFFKLVKAVDNILSNLESILLHFDEAKAFEIIKADDAVDQIYKDLMIHIIKSNNDDVAAKTVSKELLCAKNLERLADQAINVICEVYYIHNGKRLEKNAIAETVDSEALVD